MTKEWCDGNKMLLNGFYYDYVETIKQCPIKTTIKRKDQVLHLFVKADVARIGTAWYFDYFSF